MLAIAEQQPLNETKMPYLEPLAILEIDDPFAKCQRNTGLSKRRRNRLKVISGDNPVTVSNIARRAGLPVMRSYIDLSTKTTEAEVRSVQQYTVFGRVSPQQNEPLSVS